MELWEKVPTSGDTFLVRLRKHQVEPSGGCAVGFPIWLVTRLRWQVSREKRWAVEVIRERRWKFGELLQRSLYSSFEEAEQGLLDAVSAIEDAGRFERSTEGSEDSSPSEPVS